MHEELTTPAAKYGKSPAQIALRWAVQRGTVVTPKSVRLERLGLNLDIYDFELTSDEMDAILSLNRNRRFNDPALYSESFWGSFHPIFD